MEVNITMMTKKEVKNSFEWALETYKKYYKEYINNNKFNQYSMEHEYYNGMAKAYGDVLGLSFEDVQDRIDNIRNNLG